MKHELHIGRLDPETTYENEAWRRQVFNHGGILKDYNCQQRLYEQGSPADRLILVTHGLVASIFANEHMEEPKMIDLHGPGEFVGLRTAIDGKGPNNESAVAHSERVFTIGFPVDVMDKWPDTAFRADITKGTRKQLAYALERQAKEKAYMNLSAAQRVKLTILDLARRFGEIDEKNASVKVHYGLLQDDIAALAGTTRETVSRVVAVLRRNETFVSNGIREGFSIPDMAKLEEAVRKPY